jgi:peptidoglycan/LPS O-acetylase OafA/YrhL
MDMPLLKKPSGYVPLLMSALALAGILAYVAVAGIPENEAPHDEGAPARIFQLFMAAQMLVIGYFAVKWLPREPRQAVSVLLLQAAGMVAAIGTIVALER